MDAKHQQQLRELEETMRTTWEDKARISEQHEKERLRLLSEQEAAAQQLNQQIETTWKLMSDKCDLELTLSHVRDVAQRSNNSVAAESCGQWIGLLKDLQRQETLLVEQETVVVVYRNSLLSDIRSMQCNENNIARSFSHISSPRKRAHCPDTLVVSTGALRQMSDKLHNIQSEMTKWTAIQKGIEQKVVALLSDVEAQIRSR